MEEIVHTSHQIPARTLPRSGACDTRVSALAGCESFDIIKFVSGCRHHPFFKLAPRADPPSISWGASAVRSCRAQHEASMGDGILAPEACLLVRGTTARFPKCPKGPGKGRGASCPLSLLTAPCQPLAKVGKPKEVVPQRPAEPKFHSCRHIVLVLYKKGSSTYLLVYEEKLEAVSTFIDASTPSWNMTGSQQVLCSEDAEQEGL